MSLSLPPGWIEVGLADCCDIVLGQSPPGHTYNMSGDGVPFLQGKTEFGTMYAVPRKYCTSPSKMAHADDVLLSIRAPVGPTNLCPMSACIGRGLAAIRSSAGIPTRYLLYGLRATEEELKRCATGTTFDAVSGADIRAHRLPLAPLNEQRRIIAEIERRFSLLDASISGLKRAQTNLKRYRASVLQTACEGKLVPTEAELARTEGRDYEPADQLLQRILVERRRRWEAGELAKMKAQGKTPKDYKWKSKYQEPAAPGAHDLPSLPEGWCWTRVEQVAETGTGATPLRSRAEYYHGGSIPWITSAALNTPHVDVAEEYITERAIQETNTKVFRRGALLIALYGEGKTRGKVSELGIDAATNQACAALVFSESAARSKPFVKLFFYRNYDAIRRLSSGGVQPNLNLGIIRDTVFGLPPLAEQARIVSKTESTLSIIEQLESAVQAELKHSERLRQSILKEAFAGRLVPQDPNDEPASVLLERIKAERANRAGGNGANRSGRRRSTTTKEQTDEYNRYHIGPRTTVSPGNARRQRDPKRAAPLQPNIFSADGS